MVEALRHELERLRRERETMPPPSASLLGAATTYHESCCASSSIGGGGGALGGGGGALGGSGLGGALYDRFDVVVRSPFFHSYSLSFRKLVAQWSLSNQKIKSSARSVMRHALLTPL